jgi:hypothetical protein
MQISPAHPPGPRANLGWTFIVEFSFCSDLDRGENETRVVDRMPDAGSAPMTVMHEHDARSERRQTTARTLKRGNVAGPRYVLSRWTWTVSAFALVRARPRGNAAANIYTHRPDDTYIIV